MKYLTILALTCLSAATQAQDSIKSYKYSAKVYADIQHLREGQSSNGYRQTMVRPVYALQMKTDKGNAHEIELTNLVFNASRAASPNVVPASFKIRSSNIVMKYEYIINLMKRKSPRLAPAIGLAAAPYFNHVRTTPTTTSGVPSRNTNFGFSGLLVPRVTYNVTSRLYLDINIPIPVLDMNHSSSKIDNPTIPAAMRINTLTRFDVLPLNTFSARIGLGIRF